MRDVMGGWGGGGGVDRGWENGKRREIFLLLGVSGGD